MWALDASIVALYDIYFIQVVHRYHAKGQASVHTYYIYPGLRGKVLKFGSLARLDPSLESFQWSLCILPLMKAFWENIYLLTEIVLSTHTDVLNIFPLGSSFFKNAQSAEFAWGLAGDVET